MKIGARGAMRFCVWCRNKGVRHKHPDVPVSNLLPRGLCGQGIAFMNGLMKAAVFAAVTAWSAGGASAVPYYVTSGQTNANTQIDAAHQSAWLFAIGAGAVMELGGGNLTIKRGPQTVLPIVLSLYLGADATGLLLDTVAVAPGAVAQSYSPVWFAFAAPVELAGGLSGASYFLALTSTTGDAGRTQYFIKGEETTTLYLQGGGTPSILANEPVPTPEPLTAAMLGAGLVGLGLALRRRMEAPQAG